MKECFSQLKLARGICLFCARFLEQGGTDFAIHLLPDLTQLFELFRVGLGEIVLLGDILGKVIEFPFGRPSFCPVR
jgi:hypothetical protein